MTAPTPMVSFAPMISLRQDIPSHVVVSIWKVCSITSWEYPLTPPAQAKTRTTTVAPADDMPGPRMLFVAPSDSPTVDTNSWLANLLMVQYFWFARRQ